MLQRTPLARALGGLCSAALIAVSLAGCSSEDQAGPSPSAEAAPASAEGQGRTSPVDQALSPPPTSIDIAWQELPGETRDVGIGGVGDDQSIWAIGGESVPGGYPVHYWNGTEWETVDGGAVAIDVSPAGHPWRVDSDNRIFEWTGAGWAERPGRGRDIGIGGDGSVWMVGTNPVPGGYGIYRWTGAEWEEAPGGAVAIDVYTVGDAAVDLQGEPWIVDEDDHILRWTGSEWARQPGAAQDIGIGANGAIWIIGTEPADGGYRVATWNGEGWAPAPGGGLRVSVNADGFPYVVTDDQRLLQGT